MTQPPPPGYGTQPFPVSNNGAHQPYQQAVSPTGNSAKPASFGFRAGSLGTPHVNALMWGRNSPVDARSGSGNWRAQPPNYAEASWTQEVRLVPTRPLLKALARECRPSPPWTVGRPVPSGLSEELAMFLSFLTPSPAESLRRVNSQERLCAVFKAVWPDAALFPMGSDAAGVPMLEDSTAQLYIPESPIATSSLEDVTARLRAVANSSGFQADFGVDYRGINTVVLTEAVSGDKAAVRFGERCNALGVGVKLLQDHIQQVPARLSVLVAITALLRQNKLLDDTGLNPVSLNCEAVALMLLSIVNSYAPDDSPDAGRLLNDFFLTFGFPAHFDCSQNSIVFSGITVPVAKLHRESQLSVLDPFDGSSNLTPKVDKVAHLLAVFNYCYTASAQYLQVSPQQRRAQSVLSTMIGGETYWGRVLALYHQGVSPYFEVVNEKKYRIASADTPF